MSLPTKEEWEALGFLVHPDLCSKSTEHQSERQIMNQPTHTPGPYSISGIAGDNHIMASVNGEKRTIAIVMDPGIKPEELEANKRLLAASTTLLLGLKACECTLRFIAAMFEEEDRHPELAKELRVKAAYCVKAIAIAEGKA